MRELSAHYTDPRLTALYDAQNPLGPDSDFYLALAGEEPLAILDVGCGTGLLTAEFARGGHDVTGVDPAAAMLAVARARPFGDRVRWIEGVTEDADGLFDLAVMTGHAFQVLLSDDAIRSCLGSVKSRLKPGGRFAFESRNPDAKAWEEWASASTMIVPGHEAWGPVTTERRTIERKDELVSFETQYCFGDGTVILSQSALRFASQGRVSELAQEAGFTDLVWYGDWDRSPVMPTSRELIVVGSF